MAISYSPVDIRGKAVEPILEEVLFANKTVSDNYVTVNTDIKAGTIFTEASVSVTAQLYTGAALSSSGTITTNLSDFGVWPQGGTVTLASSGASFT